MESLALLPTDLAPLVDPLARGAAPRQGALDVTGAALSGADAFAQFLAMFAPPLVSGHELPASGKPLPVALPEGLDVELEPAALEAPQTTPSDPMAMSVAAVWLPLRTDPHVTTVQVPLEPVETHASAPVDTGGIRAQLSAGALPAAMAFTASSSEGGGPSFGRMVSDDASATPLRDAVAPEAPLAAAEMTTGETLETETFDALVRGDALQEAPRARAELPLAAKAPAVAAADLAGTTAARLASLDPAAVQATTRGADAAGGVPRAQRKDDAVTFMASLAAPTEVATATSVEGAPPALPAIGTAPSAATSTASPPAGIVADAPVDTRNPQWQEAFAGRVQWLVDQRVGEARIKLNPPELGAVDIKISLVEDKTYVQLTAATSAARDELAQSLPRLRDLFTASGLELGGASVQSGRGGHGGASTGYEPAARHLAEALDLEPAPRALPARMARPGMGAIDVFA
jgi:hypothetical protein